MSEPIQLQIDGPIARLTLNRPDKLNALTEPMFQALRDAARDIEHSDARVAILSASGKAFCAGGDIEAWSSLKAEAFGRFWVREGHAAFDALARLRQPLIAAMGGHALGGGLELAACADLRIAEEQIKVGQPETGLGVVPGWSGTARTTRRFGVQPVRRMVLFGEVFTADEALRLGVVDKVVPKGEAVRVAEDIAAQVMARSPQATEIAKLMVNHADGEERERIVDALAGVASTGSADLAEGLAAYREKRKPVF